MLKVVGALFFSFILVGCSKDADIKDRNIKDQSAFNKLFLEYLHTEGLSAKEPLLQMIDVIKKSNPKFFDRDHMLGLTYARLYVVELAYGDRAEAENYLIKFKKLKMKTLHPKEDNDFLQVYPKEMYETIRRVDKEKGYPEWKKLVHPLSPSVSPP